MEFTVTHSIILLLPLENSYFFSFPLFFLKFVLFIFEGRRRHRDREKMLMDGEMNGTKTHNIKDP